MTPDVALAILVEVEKLERKLETAMMPTVSVAIVFTSLNEIRCLAREVLEPAG